MLHIRQDYNTRIQDNEGLIPELEPVMLFRAQDEHTPAVLRHYALQLRKAGNEPMAEQVSQWVEKVVEWQTNNGSKAPDVPKQMQLSI